MSNPENYISTELYIWNKISESVKHANTLGLLGFKKSLMIYFNDILEFNFNMNDTCTWMGWNYWAYTAYLTFNHANLI